MSFPPATEMFQFAGFASTAYGFSGRYPCGWVSPFGNPRIKDCSHLPEAYRSVPRPSSPPGAKASTKCPSSLDNETTTADPTAGNQKHEIPPPAASTDPAQKRHPSFQSPIHRVQEDPTTCRKRHIAGMPKTSSRFKDHNQQTNIGNKRISATNRSTHQPPDHPVSRSKAARRISTKGRAFWIRAFSWWSRTESNRRPPACKAGALPTELRPLTTPDPCPIRVMVARRGFPAGLASRVIRMVGLGRLELPTSRLSGVRSNQLSYRPCPSAGTPILERR
jgi:hypothetical protein